MDNQQQELAFKKALYFFDSWPFGESLDMFMLPAGETLSQQSDFAPWRVEINTPKFHTFVCTKEEFEKAKADDKAAFTKEFKVRGADNAILTKRETFAKAAMQGLSTTAILEDQQSIDATIEMSVRLADALLKELENSTTKENNMEEANDKTLPKYGEPVLIKIKGVVQNITYELKDGKGKPDRFEPHFFEHETNEVLLADEIDAWAPVPSF